MAADNSMGASQVHQHYKRFNARKEEPHAMRIMIMQHRYVLNLMMAMQGRLCAKRGTACCTFISANDADNGTLLEVN